MGCWVQGGESRARRQRGGWAPHGAFTWMECSVMEAVMRSEGCKMVLMGSAVSVRSSRATTTEAGPGADVIGTSGRRVAASATLAACPALHGLFCTCRLPAV